MHIKRSKETRRPQVLTGNGRAELVMQDVEATRSSWTALIARRRLLEFTAVRGLALMRRGEWVPAEEA